MTFPNYKKILFWVPVGWIDNGPVKLPLYHKDCGKLVNHGEENGGFFLYCPKCKIKIQELGNLTTKGAM